MGITRGKPLPPEVRDQIMARTDGVPLFIEELTKTVLESGLLREAEGHFELTGRRPIEQRNEEADNSVAGRREND